MPLRRWIDQSLPLRSTPASRRIEATPDTWLACAQDVAAIGGRLLALWADGAGPVTVYAALIAEPTVLLLALEISESAGDLSKSCRAVSGRGAHATRRG